MANNISTSSIITNVMGASYQNSCIYQKYGNYDMTNAFARISGAGLSAGVTVSQKEPGYGNVTRGTAFSAQNLSDLTRPYTYTENDIVNLGYSLSQFERIFEIVGGDKAVTMTDISDKKLQQIDQYSRNDVMKMCVDFEVECNKRMSNSAYITPIDDPSKFKALTSKDDLAEIDTLSYELGYNTADYGGLLTSLTPSIYQQVVNTFNNSFNTTMNENALFKNMIGRANELANLEIYRCNNYGAPHEPGEQFAASETFQVASYDADTNVLALKALTGTTATRLFKKGDRIWLPDNFITSPSRDPSSPTTRRLVVTVAQDANGNGDGTCNVIISEQLRATGRNVNVDSLPANNDPAQLMGKHQKILSFIKPGLSLMPARLEQIGGAEYGETTDSDLNVSLHMYKQGSIDNLANKYRISMLMGIVPNPQWIIVREVPVA